jgi:hypothetical protein
MEGGEATHLLRGASTTHRELLQAQASLIRRTVNQSTNFDFSLCNSELDAKKLFLFSKKMKLFQNRDCYDNIQHTLFCNFG